MWTQATHDIFLSIPTALATEDKQSAACTVLGVDLLDVPEYAPGEDAASGRAVRNTYAVKLAYYGPAFDAWAWACDTPNTTQGVVQRALAAACNLDPGQQVRSHAPCSRVCCVPSFLA